MKANTCVYIRKCFTFLVIIHVVTILAWSYVFTTLFLFLFSIFFSFCNFKDVLIGFFKFFYYFDLFSARVLIFHVPNSQVPFSSSLIFHVYCCYHILFSWSFNFFLDLCFLSFLILTFLSVIKYVLIVRVGLKILNLKKIKITNLYFLMNYALNFFFNLLI